MESEGTKVQNSYSPLLCCNLDFSALLILTRGAVFFSEYTPYQAAGNSCGWLSLFDKTGPSPSARL